ncbi:MAG: carbohydrate ABC transporter permease [Anaerolineae bacterium]
MRYQMLISKLIIHIIVGAGALLMLLPLYWMVVSAFKPLPEIMTVPVTFIPVNATLENFRGLLAETFFARSMLNSTVIALANVVLQVFFCSLAGFAFAKYRFPGRDVLFTLVLGTVMIPQYVTLIPNYIVMGRIGWLDTWAPLIIPGIANAFGIFWMRQYIATVPDELLDAARIDGAGEFGTYWRIVVPIIKPGLVTLALFIFSTSWNEFLLPLVYLRSKELYTVQLTMANIFRVQYKFNYHWAMASAILATLPMGILFATLQKQFISGLTLGGLKG